MLETKAVFKRKDTDIQPADCVVDKVIELSKWEFDYFSRNLLKDHDFLRDNPIDTTRDDFGRIHCLLVVGEGYRDGILVNTEGYDYARYTAFMPNAEYFLSIGRYSALEVLNKKLTSFVDVIAEQAGMGSPDKSHGSVDLERWGDIFGIDFMTNGVLRNTVLTMLDERPEIWDWELDKNMLTVYRAAEKQPIENFSGDSERTEKPSVLNQIKEARSVQYTPTSSQLREHGGLPENKTQHEL